MCCWEMLLKYAVIVYNTVVMYMWLLTWVVDIKTFLIWHKKIINCGLIIVHYVVKFKITSILHLTLEKIL